MKIQVTDQENESDKDSSRDIQKKLAEILTVKGKMISQKRMIWIMTFYWIYKRGLLKPWRKLWDVKREKLKEDQILWIKDQMSEVKGKDIKLVYFIEVRIR